MGPRVWSGYRVGWQVLAGLLAALGLIALEQAADPVTAVVTLGTLWLLGAMISVLWTVEETTLRSMVVTGLVGGLAATSLLGATVVLGLLAPVLGALVAVTSPPALSWVRRRVAPPAPARQSTPQPTRQSNPSRRSGFAPASGPVQVRSLAGIDSATEPGLTVADVISDADLCLAWRSSYVALQRARGPVQAAHSVEIRALLIEELERRNPRGMQAWLHSGPRPAGDPTRHLLPRREGSAGP